MANTKRGGSQTPTSKPKVCFCEPTRNCSWDRAPCRRPCPRSVNPSQRITYVIERALVKGDWTHKLAIAAAWEILRWGVYVWPIDAGAWQWCDT